MWKKMQPAIAVRQLTKNYAEGSAGTLALRGVDLDAHAGELLMLMGPSGSGKTTLLSILGCILTATSGHVIVDGQEVDANRPAELPAIRKKSIGFVFQQYNLFPALTALENVEYALNIKGTKGKAAKEQANTALDTVGLGDRKNYLPRDMSGGQKQRIAIARALVARPAVLLA